MAVLHVNSYDTWHGTACEALSFQPCNLVGGGSVQYDTGAGDLVVMYSSNIGFERVELRE